VRAILLLLIGIIGAAILLVMTGLVDIRQTDPAVMPKVSVNEDGIQAKGGQAPSFDVETGTVSIGNTTRDVTVPTLEVESAADGTRSEEPSEPASAAP